MASSASIKRYKPELLAWPKTKKKKKKIKTRRKTKRLKAKIRQLDATYQTAGGFNDRNHADVSMMLIMMMATLGEKLHCSIKKDRRKSGKIYIFHPNKSKLNKIGFLREIVIVKQNTDQKTI